MRGADNQQERPSWVFLQLGILRDYTPDTLNLGEDIVRTLWRHREVGRNDQPAINENVRDGSNKSRAKFLVG